MSSSSYRQDIDGLRAIAVLAVVFYHTNWPLFKGGYIGVDIFFVISGFLITSLIMKDIENGSFTLVDFWERRARRILPALLAVMAFTFLSGWFFLLPGDYARLGQQLMSQTVFSSNMLFSAQEGYFMPQSRSELLLHTWSLAVEEQFYLFFPLLLIFLARDKGKIPLYLLLGALFSYLVHSWSLRYYPTASFYLLPGRAWELLLGALIVFIPAVNWSRLEKDFITFVGLTVVLLSIFLFKKASTNTWFLTLVPCLGASLVIWMGKETAPSVTHRVLGNPLLTGIGLISYSIYLWHWPVFVYIRYLTLSPPNTKMILLCISSTMVLAVLSWVFIETPVRKKKVLRDRRGLFKTLFSFLFALGLAGGALVYFKGMPARFSPEADLYAAAAYDEDPAFSKCFKQDGETFDPKEVCHLGKNAPAFAAFGDSEMYALMPVLNHLAKIHEIGGLAASYGSCPPLFGVAPLSLSNFSACLDFNEIMLDTIHKNHIRHVILAARWIVLPRTSLVRTSLTDPLSDAKNREALQKSLMRMIEEIQKMGADVWIVKSPPEYPFDVPRQLARTLITGGDVHKVGEAFSDYKLFQTETDIEPIFHELEKYHVRFIAPADYLCADKGFCPAEEEGHSLYKDSFHLSTFGAMKVQKAFEEAFSKLAIP